MASTPKVSIEIRPKKTALLIIDAQNIFTPWLSSALPQITSLHNFFLSNDWPIFFTQHGHPPEEMVLPSRNQLVNKWGIDGSIRTGSTEWQLIPSVSKLQQESQASLVQKTTYDAFLNTGLHWKLVESRVERIVVCGVMADCACDTTARSAFNRGWEAWLVRDACGSREKASHDAALKQFEFAFGETPMTLEVIQRLKSGE